MSTWLAYSVGVCFSVVLHGILLLALILGWQAEPEPRKLIRPQYINATLLEVKPNPRPKVTEPKRPKEDRAAKLQREKQLVMERQKKQARLESIRKQKLAEEKAAKAKAEKVRAEKKRLEKQRAEREQRQKERARLAQEKSLMDALAEEEAFIESENDAQIIGSYSAYIQERVVNNWSRPSSARRGMVAELAIQLVPTGRVISVKVVKSSDNEAFDRSAERAVRKVDRFDRLQELAQENPILFDREFRRFRLVFKPEDLRL